MNRGGPNKQRANVAHAFGKIAFAPSLPPWLKRDWLWGSILILAVALVYQPVWYAGFIWDDNVFVTTNPVIVGPLGLKEIWTTSAADICPLTMTAFWIEHALWGLAPLPYHLVNVLLHGACAVLLWQVLLSLRVHGAWLGAALWALHPVQVESAAWIIEMKNTQSGLFFLLSILFFVRGLGANELDGQASTRWNYALTLLFAAMAMASKSSTVILPLVLCLCAWWVEGRWNWRNLVKLGPIFLMSLAAGVVSIWTQRLQLAAVADPQWTRTWPERLVTAGDAVWFYLGKLLWPYPLMIVYPSWGIDTGRLISYLPLLAVIAVLVVFWLMRESWSRPWLFAFAYFLLGLLPVLGFIDQGYQRFSLVADHFQYLASMGLLALVGAGIARLGDSAALGKSWAQSCISIALLLVLGTVSWQRVWAYENEETIWTDALAKNPDCWVGYNNLGFALLGNGQVDEAMVLYQKALKIKPDFADAHNNLGYALLQKGRVNEAIGQFQEALKIEPEQVNDRTNLGVALLLAGRVDEAMAQYQKALEIDPNDARAYDNLGNALARKGRVDEAIVEYKEALGIDPNDDKAHYNLGLLFLQSRQLDKAIAQFQKALEINPNFADGHNNLGIALAQKGQMDEAISEFQKALELKPDFTDAQNNLVRAQTMAHQSK